MNEQSSAKRKPPETKRNRHTLKSEPLATASTNTASERSLLQRVMITINPVAANTAICAACFLGIVILKIVRPDTEPYSFLAVLIVLLLRAFAKLDHTSDDKKEERKRGSA